MVLPGETIKGGAASTCGDCGITPKLQVCHSPAGYYVGTYCECGPYSRESDYYKTHELAQTALDSGAFGRNNEPAPSEETTGFKPDLTVQVLFDIRSEDALVVKTNVKPERLVDFIFDYIRAVHMGEGEDVSEPQHHDVFDITIGLQLAGDVWAAKTNCGNQSLEAGILLRTMQLLKEGKGRVE